MTSAVEPSEREPASDPWIGRVLAGRYRIDAHLGSGGMGAVYRGQHLALDREVAIKILHPRLTEDPVVARRFDREALAASRLDHPGCVQMLDAGTAEGGTKFLVMQMLSGCELRSAQDGPMPAARVVELTLQILRALEHAHRRGLVHRDLKPENVIITRDDDDREVVKLLDFGIVKLLSGDEGDDKLTRAGMVFGTPRYMSPEQAAGGKVDARADLYTVGVLMYEMLAGVPPFQGDEMGIVLRMHILADPPPLPEHVPAPIAAVIMRLLQKRAVDRFASAKETHDALEAAANAVGPGAPAVVPLAAVTMPSASAVTAPPTGPTWLPPSGVAHTVLAMPAPQPTHPASRARTNAIGSIVALVVLALGIVIGWALLSGPDDRSPSIDSERPPMGVAAPEPEAPEPETPGSETPEPETPASTHADAPSIAAPASSKSADRDREARKKREEKEREARKKREEKEREARRKREEKGKGKGRKGRGRPGEKGRDD